MAWTDAFAQPQLLGLLLAVALFGLWSLRRQKHRSGLLVPGLSRLPPLPRGRRERLRHVPFVLRMLVLSLVVGAAAGPRRQLEPAASARLGREVLLAVDTSDSMLTEDFQPNRLEAAKRLIDEFIQQRGEDRIALQVFGGEAHLVCPSTLDHERLRRFVADVRPGAAGDGTAIGLAVASGVARLRTSASKGRVMVLLTDGVSTSDDIDIRDAAALAAREGVRIHAIGVGSEGPASYPLGPFREIVRSRLDEGALRTLTSTSGGRFFRAGDDDALRAVFREIDTLERGWLEEARYGVKVDTTHEWLLLGVLLLALEAALTATLLRSLP